MLIGSIVKESAGIQIGYLNTLPNSSFPSLSGWTSTNMVTSALDHVFSGTATAANGSCGRAPSPITVTNRYYYARALVKAPSNLVRIQLGASQKYHSGSNAFELLSVRHKATSNAHQFSIVDTRASAWTTIFMKEAMVVDLTTTYGAGNEPTIEWCDANL